MPRSNNRPLYRSFAAPESAALLILSFLFVLPVLACASGQVELPNPRRLVIYSGARLTPEKERMEEVDARVREQMDSITLDPSFMIITQPQEGPVYPWEQMRLNAQGDTVNLSYQPGGGLRRGAYLIYAHLHLMAAQNRLDRWLPEAVGADEFELEKAILRQVAEVWLYQRSIFDARPYSILDEITYASENGFLDEFILTARPGSFVEARRDWLAENPDGNAAYVEWFQRTFERDPPGWSRGSQ
ncbi:MAG: hypothetical protein F4106_12350 [Gemmatimonadetes bacterium]|nr:hypothetical protein [Gemmatimonadota bacterium]MXX70597.1 hypothetical protein [Gemmatimonadota bacterium]MYC90982.1 hypothetical protein [Gemmatimonadota bacterium]MYG34050.1 hypothetical protein [Gemmatimonadota bacterium]MYJ18805.1 hypothetical protein [Gemmatimonadota bacterium]